MVLEAQDVHKTFGTHQALDGVNLSIPSGSLTALLGPSGCGKTTLLRLFAGLEQADRGVLRIGGEDQSGLSLQDRRVGFVFQHYALFRHMDVFSNVAFGLRARPRKERLPEKEIRARVVEILNLVQLGHAARRMPDQLSGGQRQRVALARSLVIEPRILLLDEPFGALDANVRKDLRRWLRGLQEKLGITTILVTHDQEEALEVADQIVLMNKGRVEQSGSPEELYRRPANLFVYRFLGTVNLFSGRKDGGGESWARPHEIRVEKTAFPGAMVGSIHRVTFGGPVLRLELSVREPGWLQGDAQLAGGQGVERIEAEVQASDGQTWNVGETVWFAPQATLVFQDQGSGI